MPTKFKMWILIFKKSAPRAAFFLFVLLAVAVAPRAAFAAIPNDPLFQEQWFLPKINVASAWDKTTGSKNVIVAVIDTGVDLDHPDLVGNIWVNADEISGDGIDNDSNGYVDDVNGWDFYDDDFDPNPTTGSGYRVAGIVHGTVISGIIGAIGNNAQGVSGINWRASIMPLRALDHSGVGSTSDVADAINYAVNNGARVINLSFTSNTSDSSINTALENAYKAGVFVVAAVGNNGKLGGEDNSINPVYPACLVSSVGDWVFGVAATDKDDAKASFSNYGCTDLSAPGVDIFSTTFQDSAFDELSQYYDGGWEGTSVSAPMVVGAAALIFSAYSTITLENLRTVLQLSADPIKKAYTAWDGKLGTGRLNIGRAFEIAPSFAVASSADSADSGAAPAPTDGAAALAGNFSNSWEVIKQYFAYEQTYTGGIYVGARVSNGAVEIQVDKIPLNDPRVAFGDINKDGTLEKITSPVSGNAPEIKIYNSLGGLLMSFYAKSESDRNGLFVATADVDGDGSDEIVVSSDVGGDPTVRVFNRIGALVAEFTAYNSAFLGGVRIAGFDVDGDGRDEVIVGAGPGGGPHVRVWKFIPASRQ